MILKNVYSLFNTWKFLFMVKRWVIQRLYGFYGSEIFSLIDMRTMIQLMTFGKENSLTLMYMCKGVGSSHL